MGRPRKKKDTPGPSYVGQHIDAQQAPLPKSPSGSEEQFQAPSASQVRTDAIAAAESAVATDRVPGAPRRSRDGASQQQPQGVPRAGPAATLSTDNGPSHVFLPPGWSETGKGSFLKEYTNDCRKVYSIKAAWEVHSSEDHVGCAASSSHDSAAHLPALEGEAQQVLPVQASTTTAFTPGLGFERGATIDDAGGLLFQAPALLHGTSGVVRLLPNLLEWISDVAAVASVQLKVAHIASVQQSKAGKPNPRLKVTATPAAGGFSFILDMTEADPTSTAERDRLRRTLEAQMDAVGLFTIAGAAGAAGASGAAHPASAMGISAGGSGLSSAASGAARLAGAIGSSGGGSGLSSSVSAGSFAAGGGSGHSSSLSASILARVPRKQSTSSSTTAQGEATLLHLDPTRNRLGSSWSIHVVSVASIQQVTLQVTVGNEDLNDDEDLDEVENSAREKEVAASSLEDVINSSEVFQCAIKEGIENTHDSVIQHVEKAPPDILPDQVQQFVTQLIIDKKAEAAYKMSETFRQEAAQLTRRGDKAEEEDGQREGLQAALQLGSLDILQYGNIWDSYELATISVRSKSAAALRVLGGTGDKCKIFLCQTNRDVRNKEKDKADKSKTIDEGIEVGDKGKKGEKDANGSRVANFFAQDGCHCVIQVQEMTMAALRRGSYRRTAWSKHFYGTSTTEYDPISDKSVLRNPLPSLPSLEVHSGRPDDDVVWVCTLYRPHSCLAVPVPPSICAESTSCAASNAPSTSTIPSSAGALLQATALGRRVTSTQHFNVIKAKFDASWKRQWTVEDVLVEMKHLDSAATKSMAFTVLRKLRTPCVLSPVFNVSLLQGLANYASAQGFGIAFHLVTATTVANMIVDITKRHYKAFCKKNPEAKAVPFSVSHIADVLDKYSKDDDTSHKYLIGWTLIPPNMMFNNLTNFIPVDAIDGAAMRGAAKGTMFIRATKDANDNVHPISVSVLLASECNQALEAVMSAENLLLKQMKSPEESLTRSPLDSPGRITITDGGLALMGVQKVVHPTSNLWRCEHHMKSELRKRCKKSVAVYEKLLTLPFGQIQAAEALFEELPLSSPLHKIPKEQICQAYLSGSLHGTKTNNDAEVSNHMFYEARHQKELCNSLLAALMVFKSRHELLSAKVKQLKAHANFKSSAELLQPDDHWPENTVTEPVLTEYRRVRERAKELVHVEQINRDQWRVRISEEVIHQIDLSCFRPGPNYRLFHKLCSCGKGGIRKLWCKHVQSVFNSANTSWQSWVPIWGQAKTWELQVGPDFQVPGGKEIIDGLVKCHGAGLFVKATQPEIHPNPKGRPATLNRTAADQRRQKGIVELVHEAPKVQAALGSMAATGGLGYNPGGAGVPKACSMCRQKGHRRKFCPLRDEVLAEARATAADEFLDFDGDNEMTGEFSNVMFNDKKDERPSSLAQHSSATVQVPLVIHPSKTNSTLRDNVEDENDAERETSMGSATASQLLPAPRIDSLESMIQKTKDRRETQAKQVEFCTRELTTQMDVGIRVNQKLAKAYGVGQDSSIENQNSKIENLNAKELKAKLTELGAKPVVGNKMLLVRQLQEILAASTKNPDTAPVGSSSEPDPAPTECITTDLSTDTTRKKEVLGQQLVQALIDDNTKELDEEDSCDAMEFAEEELVAGFVEFDVIRDGSSFFRCISLHLLGDEHACSSYRELLIDQLPLHNAFIIELIRVPEGLTDRDVVESFAIEVANTDQCVTEETVALTAKVIGLDIVVHDGNLKQKQFLGPDHAPYSNPAIHLFFEREHYRYLRPRTPELRPVRPDRYAFGNLYCDAAQERFDESLLKWKFDCELFDAAIQAWAERTSACAASEALPVAESRTVAASPVELEENTMCNEAELAAARTAAEAHNEAEASLAHVESESRTEVERAGLPATSVASPTSPSKCLEEKHWKKRSNGRLSSSLYRPEPQVGNFPEAGQEDEKAPEAVEDSNPWMFYMRRELDGSEKGCLLLSGAQELSPDVPLDTLVPLGEDDDFKPRSVLTSFWNMLMDEKMSSANEFYFVRKSGHTCDGVMLLKMMSRLRVATSTKVTIEIIRCCACGVAGNGSLLVFHLCSLLYLLEPQTELRVCLRACKESSRGFWTKVGFAAPGERPEKRSKKTFVADELTLNVADRETWEAYVKSKNPTMTISDDEVGRVASVNVDLLKSLWSEPHASAWLTTFDRIRGAPVSTMRTQEDIKAAIEESKARIARVPKELIGIRVTVKGNGTCWLYAVMAGFGDMLEHANPCAVTRKQQPENKVTRKDYSISRILIDQMKRHVLSSFDNLHVEVLEDLRTQIQGIEAATNDRRGTPGGGWDSYCVLANLLEIHIVCLDLSRPDKFYVFNGAETCRMVEIPMDELESKLTMLIETVGGNSFVVVEFNGEHGRAGHFAGYWPPPSRRFKIPSFLRSSFPGLTHLAYVAGSR